LFGFSLLAPGLPAIRARHYPQIAVPTLVVHARGDRLVPFEAGGRELAAGIAGAKLVVLETDNHGFGPWDPTYDEYLQALDDFLAEDPELAERY
jgi:pimeloyl-ACP methyl ester carboxylesterase